MAKEKFCQIYERVLLGALHAIIILRLIVWKFLKHAGPFEKVDLANDVFVITILAVFLLFLIKKIAFEEKIISHSFDKPLWVFVAIAFSSFLYSIDPQLSLRTAMMWFAYISFCYMVIDLLSTPRRVKAFLITVTGCVAAAAILGIKELIYFLTREVPADEALRYKDNRSVAFIYSRQRIVSFLGWPNVLSSFFILLVPIILSFCFWLKERWVKIALIVVAVLSLIALFAAASVGAVLSLFISGMIVLGSFFYHKRENIPTWVNYAIIAVMIGMVAITGSIIARRFLGQSWTSVPPRIEHLNAAASVIQEKPVLGSGLGTFHISSQPFVKTIEGFSTFAHNSYLQLISELGFIGGIAFLIFLYVLGLELRKIVLSAKNSNEKLAILFCIWGLLAFLIHNMVSFTLLKGNIAFYWWLGLGYFLMIKRHVLQKELSFYSSKVSQNISFVMFGITMIIFLNMISVFEGNKYYYQGTHLLNENKVEQAGAVFVKAKQMNYQDAKHYLGVGHAALQIFETTKDQTYLTSALEALEQSQKRSPELPNTYVLLGRAHQYLGNTKQAKKYYQKARALAPVLIK